ncbi:MAG: ParB family transcriptional regulator, chromosome partitioning protein [Moorella sp. (in: firmicutes)]|jgi:ParB family chromosome partitioning protein|uniref:ParB/RepB/Spo0J family partition protein n=1 Tax=unclassified Neomoorella TaxID=2676739 RepID=UPI0010FFB61D|nr:MULTISPECIES: ParB/RepB/Spo0J family partition protein [unclassified Moorella (in: firmicutes)]MDK2817336.1 ParB family transcriptional regulator, chromosome partitioning protein [Moorella sp. (in: firmicutes)]GEA14455.1 chromosome partitioning protein ParB [Moorella sp. E308F]GEA18173.1 chromosome partitioning protein ParB [Moorella sp. E306M]
MVKRGLGRGLEALLPAIEENEVLTGEVTRVAVDRIVAGRHQPRRDFDATKLEELAQSIKSHGVIQPIVVKPIGDERYELIAGERRLRACKIAGLREIPAIIKDLDARETAEIALIENLQREDLNPMEEAEAYQALINEHNLTQEEIARRVGKSRPVIANALRLFQLPEEIQEMLRKSEISTGHARIILSLKDREQQLMLARKIKEEGLAVRETEIIAKKLQASIDQPTKKERKNEKVDLEVKQLEDRLQHILSTKVKLSHGKNKGKIEIYYFGTEDLERIIAVLTRNNVSRETF